MQNREQPQLQADLNQSFWPKKEPSCVSCPDCMLQAHQGSCGYMGAGAGHHCIQMHEGLHHLQATSLSDVHTLVSAIHCR